MPAVCPDSLIDRSIRLLPIETDIKVNRILDGQNVQIPGEFFGSTEIFSAVRIPPLQLLGLPESATCRVGAS